MAKVITAEEAVKLIHNDDTVAILGSGGGICEPSFLLKKIGETFVRTGAPRNLTLYHANGIGDKDSIGTDALAYEGLVKRDIAGHWGMAPKMAQLALEEKIEAYNFPQGVMSQMFSAIAAHTPGVITKTGLHTYIDPRVEGGKMNKSAKEDLVEVLELAGQEWLWYKPVKLNIGLVRGTTADVKGNITYEEEAAILEGAAIAQAVHNSGGIVICQVKYLSQEHAKAKEVQIPGIYVDYIVVDSEQKQTCERVYDPALTGNLRTPFESVPPMDLNTRKVVARRAAKELRPGMIINLGVGMPDGVASIAQENGILDTLHFNVEQGIIGGMPMRGVIFGVAHNPDAMVNQTWNFNFYDGGGLDCCFLGMAQLDEKGNVNSSKTGSLLSGCGGAINISQGAKKVVFCGTFTAKGMKAAIGGGKIGITKEGEIHKIVSEVDQITFSGEYAASVHQPVMYITERCVFELQDGKLVLTEIAPGIDLEKDILAQMDFEPVISENLKVMDEDIFRE